MKRPTLALLAGLLLLSGCTLEKKTYSQTANDSIPAAPASVEPSPTSTESAADMLDRAQEEIKRDMAATSKATLTELIRLYPDSNEAALAQLLLDGSVSAKETPAKKEEPPAIKEEEPSIESNEEDPSAIEAPTTAKSEELQKQRNAMLAGFRTKYDEVRELDFYMSQSSPEYDDINAFYPYLVKKNDQLNLRLRIQYKGEDWLFINHYIFKVDQETFDLYPEYDDVKRDNSGFSVWEYYDYSAVDSIEMLHKIVNSTKTIIRRNGDQYYSDYIVTQDEKDSLRAILEAYELYSQPNGI
ncbi:hypothetical protein [Gorillibacterium sp. CAU 1737]|uniref:hypothetical protein n=1 Tax=Gorillibacterium sp. CAU 1737 TaxID=3140362 RepID=UPI003261BEAC